jgi:hypothetical protein
VADHAGIEENLDSDEVLHRLIFDVMILPKVFLSGSFNLLVDIHYRCEKRLIDVIRHYSGGKITDAASFATIVIGSEVYSGVAFLGCQQQSLGLEHLKTIWHKHSTNVLSQPRDDDSFSINTPLVAEGESLQLTKST